MPETETPEWPTPDNQPELYGDLPLWAGDGLLRGEIERIAPAHADRVKCFAGAIGTEEAQALGRDANRYSPQLKQFDRFGNRIDRIDFHPAYHHFMREGLEAGYAALAHTATEPGGHSAHAAMVYLLSQVEPGTCCPMTMTYAAIPALEAGGAPFKDWVKGCLAARYDPSDKPAADKAGLTIGMAMTEKQGGSDVRANTTRAEPDGDHARLYGHKWFCSAPASDGFLTLAQAEKGLSCYLVPRILPDGARNSIVIDRLKDKLGNRANASAEIRYEGAYAIPLGDEGDGVRTILKMVHHTRLDTAMAPAGLMRWALVEAKWWADNRLAFGKPLVDQPLMRAVLADLALDWRAALMMGLRIARAFDKSGSDPAEAALARIGVALAKFWANMRCPGFVLEAMQTLGGSGYVEDSPMPWLYREAPLNGIWEGSGNIICLDVLRSIEKAPETLDALAAEIEFAAGTHHGFDAAMTDCFALVHRGIGEREARVLTERLALLFAASQLLKSGDVAADGFIRARLAGEGGTLYGALPGGIDEKALLESI